MRWNRNLGRGERAQTLIEFALVTPMILFFLFMIIDFGVAMDRRILLQHAVREGARYGAVNSDISFVQARTAEQSQNIILPSDVIVCYMDPKTNTIKTNPDVGDAVDVCEKNFKYDPFMIRGGPFDHTIPKIEMFLTGSARLEQKPTSASDPRCPCP